VQAARALNAPRGFRPRLKTGSSIAARMAMMATTTRSSTSVKPFRVRNAVCAIDRGAWRVVLVELVEGMPF